MELLYVFGTVVLINCAYYILFSNFSFSKSKRKTEVTPSPISLLVCAKNEADNLKTHIPLWLAQEHPNFELILINDASSDDTLEVMESFAEQDARIKIVNVENNEAFWGNKKYALTLGIKRATHERMIFTDADCAPASPQWLLLMATSFSDNKHIVLGYGPYSKEKGFLNQLIRFETLMTAVQYFSYAIVGNPYMGVGRNLAYTGTLFYAHNGFINHIKVNSGDDDLFVNETANRHNTALCIEPDAFTYSHPKRKWADWYRQKRRHYSTSKYYKPKHKLLLGAYYLFNLLFWILAPLTLIGDFWEIGLGIILFRILFQYIVIGKAIKKLKEGNLIFWIPFLELFLILSQIVIFSSNPSGKNVIWK